MRHGPWLTSLSECKVVLSFYDRNTITAFIKIFLIFVFAFFFSLFLKKKDNNE